MKQFNIEVQVHKPINDGYRVKVLLHDIGLFFNGFMVFPPNEQHEKWLVYPPVQLKGFKRIYHVEFNKKMPLWLEIVEACIASVQLERLDKATEPDYDLPKEDWDKKIDDELGKVYGEDG